MKKRTASIVICTTLLLLLGIIGILAPQTSRAAPNLVNYQGELTDSLGTPVPDGGYPMTFRVFNADIGGTPLWEETQTVTVSNGIYNVLLGSGTTNLSYGTFDPTLFSGDNRWLEVMVDTEVLTPRQQFTSVTYALQAEKAKICSFEDMILCYSGPANTLNLGVCKAGFKKCNVDGTGFDTCQGEVLPQAETCDGLDNNCDGQADESFNLSTDVNNCGACGNTCLPGAPCVSGTCGCAAGQVDCGSGCIDLSSDPNNCGSCGSTCGSAQDCTAGQCTSIGCLGGLVQCGIDCVDLTNDPNNCGTCGNACGSAQDCTGGQCTNIGCLGGLVQCGIDCVDLTNDPNNCGSCGSTCGSAQDCTGGQCTNI